MKVNLQGFMSLLLHEWGLQPVSIRSSEDGGKGAKVYDYPDSCSGVSQLAPLAASPSFMLGLQYGNYLTLFEAEDGQVDLHHASREFQKGTVKKPQFSMYKVRMEQ